MRIILNFISGWLSVPKIQKPFGYQRYENLTAAKDTKTFWTVLDPKISTKTFWIRKIRKPADPKRGRQEISPLSPSSSDVKTLQTELICTSSSITNYPSSSDRSICVRGASASSLPEPPLPPNTITMEPPTWIHHQYDA
jgi:hypothetical protein